jgi:hypothetical protein
MKMDMWEVDAVLRLELPTRKCKWAHNPYLTPQMKDYVIKLGGSEENTVYWKYYEYTIACPFNSDMSASRKMLEAHHRGMIAVAYLECHCQECRFVPRTYCPGSWDVILGAFEEKYPEKSRARYDGGRGYVDDERFFQESPCLIMEAFRARHLALGLE